MAREPALRIGDAERDAAVRSLTDHFVAGRLDLDELETRTGSVLRARTQADLDAHLVDLPALAVVPQVPDRRRRRPARLVAAAVTTGLLAGLVAFGASANPGVSGETHQVCVPGAAQACRIADRPPWAPGPGGHEFPRHERPR